jgi:hypothetical protein
MANGLSLSGTSNLSTGQKILITSAMMAFEPSAPNPDLIMSVNVPQGHKQAEVGTFARLSQASGLTEGVDLAQVEQLVANYLSLTPTEHGIIATLSKRLIKRQGDASIVSQTGTQLAESLRRRQDNDVIAIYDTFTKSIVGAGSATDITYFRGAVAYLKTDNDSAYGPAPMPIWASLHPEAISDLIADLTDPGAVASARFGLSAEMLQRWWRGSDRLYSVQVFESGNQTRDSGDDVKGAIFHQKAIVMAMDVDAEATEQRDESLRAIEYGIFQPWAEGLRADPHGVEHFSDAAATV